MEIFTEIPNLQAVQMQLQDRYFSYKPWDNRESSHEWYFRNGVA